jgi:hypothetical protein
MRPWESVAAAGAAERARPGEDERTDCGERRYVILFVPSRTCSSTLPIPCAAGKSG